MRKKRTIVELLDDFDGTPGATTVEFAFEGIQYEIELTQEHLEEMREYLAPYIENGRKASGGRSTRKARPARRPVPKADTSAIRAWAAEQGIEVSRSGRIPAAVVEQYEAAH